MEDYFELLSGQDFPPEKYNDAQVGIPYIIGASNIYKEKIVINRWTQTPSVKTAKGDLLVVCKGAGVGKMALNDIGDMHIARQIQAIRDVSQMMSIEYIKMVVSYYIEDIIADANGLIPGLKRELLLSLMMPIPPLQEQRRIIATYEQLMSFIESIDNESSEVLYSIKTAKSKILDLAIHGKLVPQDPNDEPASELLKRINTKTIASCDSPQYGKVPSSWVISTVGEVFAINPKNHVGDDTEAAFVPMTCVADGFSNTFEYECRKWGDIKKGFVHFQDNDVAVAKISPCLENRKSVVFHDLPNGIGAGTTELNVFRCKEILPDYSLLYFKSQMFIGSCAGTYNGVVGQQRVAKSFIQELPIGIPPYNEQLLIVSKVNDIFSRLDMIEKSLQA